MTSAFRTVAGIAGLTLALAACQPSDPNAATAGSKAATAEGKAASTGPKIAGLPTEKDQASYMIGMQIGRTLEPVKDEVDLDVVMRAIRTVTAGQKPLMTDEQAQEVAQAFGQRMQAKAQAEAEAKAKTNLAEGAKFLAENAKKPGVVTTASGLQYQVITEGKGAKPGANDGVTAHYKGTLLDGTEFDSSYKRGEPASFVLNQVVPGWQEGLTLMSTGSKYRFWIPAKLGYGEQGTPGGPIPPNATLVFEVELLEINKQPGAGNRPAG